MIEEDDIIKEIRAIRAAMAEEHGYDLKAMCDTLRRLDAESGVPTVSRSLDRMFRLRSMRPSLGVGESGNVGTRGVQ